MSWRQDRHDRKPGSIFIYQVVPCPSQEAVTLPTLDHELIGVVDVHVVTDRYSVPMTVAGAVAEQRSRRRSEPLRRSLAVSL